MGDPIGRRPKTACTLVPMRRRDNGVFRRIGPWHVACTMALQVTGSNPQPTEGNALGRSLTSQLRV